MAPSFEMPIPLLPAPIVLHLRMSALEGRCLGDVACRLLVVLNSTAIAKATVTATLATSKLD